MELFALVILSISFLVGFAAIFFTTFGTLIILFGALTFALLTHFSILTIENMIIVLILYVLGEAMEYFCVIAGAKRYGASNAAVVGALIGAVLGAAVGASFLGMGLVIGAFTGIFLGAFAVELILKKDLALSLKVGVGGVFGRVGSVVAKVFIALAMTGYCVYFILH